MGLSGGGRFQSLHQIRYGTFYANRYGTFYANTDSNDGTSSQVDNNNAARLHRSTRSQFNLFRGRVILGSVSVSWMWCSRVLAARL